VKVGDHQQRLAGMVAQWQRKSFYGERYRSEWWRACLISPP